MATAIHKKAQITYRINERPTQEEQQLNNHQNQHELQKDAIVIAVPSKGEMIQHHKDKFKDNTEEQTPAFKKLLAQQIRTTKGTTWITANSDENQGQQIRLTDLTEMQQQEIFAEYYEIQINKREESKEETNKIRLETRKEIDEYIQQMKEYGKLPTIQQELRYEWNELAEKERKKIRRTMIRAGKIAQETPIIEGETRIDELLNNHMETKKEENKTRKNYSKQKTTITNENERQNQKEPITTLLLTLDTKQQNRNAPEMEQKNKRQHIDEQVRKETTTNEVDKITKHLKKEIINTIFQIARKEEFPFGFCKENPNANLTITHAEEQNDTKDTELQILWEKGPSLVRKDSSKINTIIMNHASLDKQLQQSIMQGMFGKTHLKQIKHDSGNYSNNGTRQYEMTTQYEPINTEKSTKIPRYNRYNEHVPERTLHAPRNRRKCIPRNTRNRQVQRN